MILCICNGKLKIKKENGDKYCIVCGAIYTKSKRNYSTLSKDKFYTDKDDLQ